MERSRTEKRSFLWNILGGHLDAYGDILRAKRFFVCYSLLIFISVFLSLFFRCDYIAAVVALVLGPPFLWVYAVFAFVYLDYQVDTPKTNDSYDKKKYIRGYILSIIWIVVLCFPAKLAIDSANKYRKYYAFQCREYYLEEETHMYHSNSNCNHVLYSQGYANEDDEYKEDEFEINYIKVTIDTLSGYDLLKVHNCKFCRKCREKDEDETNYINPEDFLVPKRYKPF